MALLSLTPRLGHIATVKPRKYKKSEKGTRERERWDEDSVAFGLGQS